MIQKLLRCKTSICLSLIVIILPFVSVPLFAEDEFVLKDEILVKTKENEAWTGIDVSIVGKYATKYGRPPRDPYINTDQGDLLLFVFTLAGVVGGFVIGFNARKLFFEK